MARRRYLQPEFWSNPLLSKCPAITRLLFAGLSNFADYDGCFFWDPEGLAMKILPREDFDPTEALDRLERDGFVRPYVVGGMRYAFIPNWHKHQDPHPGEKPVCPKPVDAPGFIVKIKEPKWRKEGDTAFGFNDIEKGIYIWQHIACKLLPSCGQLASNGKEGLVGKEGIEARKDAPPVPATAVAIPLKVKKGSKSRTTGLTPESVEAFQAAWDSIPRTVTQWDSNQRRDVQAPVMRGSRLEAETAFQAVVDSKVATPRQCYIAFFLYLTHGEGPMKGFVQHMSTFFGARKGTYLEWLENAKAREIMEYKESA